MPAHKGTQPPGGSRLGKPNKTTIAVKEALTLAFEGAGGVPALIEWAKTDKGRDEFYKLWVKMLPTDINATGDMSVNVIINRLT